MFGKSYFEVESPKEMRPACVLSGIPDLEDFVNRFNGAFDVVKWWLDALPFKLCSDPTIIIATAPQLGELVSKNLKNMEEWDLHTSPVPSLLNLMVLPSPSKRHSSSAQRIEQSASFIAYEVVL